MDNEDGISPTYKRWKEREDADRLASKIRRRTGRFFGFIVGFGVGIYFDFIGTGNSILGIIVGPFLIGGAFALLVTVLMFGI